MFSLSKLVIQVGAGRFLVSAGPEGKPAWSAEYRFDGEQQLADRLAELAEPVRHNRLSRRVIVRVQTPVLQRRSLTDIPPVRPVELSRLVSRAAPRYFRQNGHLLVSAARWEPEGQSPPKVARAFAVELALAEAIVEGTRRAGLSLADIVPDGTENTLSLLPPSERAGRRRAAWQGIAKLGAIAAMLWLGVGVFLWARLQVESRWLDRETARLNEPRKALVAARLAMDSASEMVIAIDKANRQRVEVAAALQALVRGLPDSTYLTELTIEQGESIKASGRSRSTSSLIASLQAEPGLGATRLEGATVRDSLGGQEWERFGLTIAPGPKP